MGVDDVCLLLFSANQLTSVCYLATMKFISIGSEGATKLQTLHLQFGI